jgi:catechol 2,3-dioxygenase-like lactoylglutathione lyase family enzyme
MSAHAPLITGLHHISLTVTDLDRSVAWYAEVLGLGELMKETHPDGNGHAIVLGKPDWSMCVGLHTHESNAAEPFQETRTGLDHVSFRVADRAELDSWAAHLDELGVAQSPIADLEGFGVLVFRDPDNIQLELISLG